MSLYKKRMKLSRSVLCDLWNLKKKNIHIKKLPGVRKGKKLSRIDSSSRSEKVNINSTKNKGNRLIGIKYDINILKEHKNRTKNRTISNIINPNGNIFNFDKYNQILENIKESSYRQRRLYLIKKRNKLNSIRNKFHNISKVGKVRLFKKYYYTVGSKKFDLRYKNKFSIDYSKLERRLDVIVWRLNWAVTLNEGRYLVVYGKVKINDKIVRDPSFTVNKYDKIKLENKISLLGTEPRNVNLNIQTSNSRSDLFYLVNSIFSDKDIDKLNGSPFISNYLGFGSEEKGRERVTNIPKYLEYNSYTNTAVIISSPHICDIPYKHFSFIDQLNLN